MCKFNILISWLILLSIIACVPDTQTEKTEINIDFNDNKYISILSLQDKQLTDSLFDWFSSADPTYRYAAVNAFSSVKDTTASDTLLKMLNDPILEVRAAAAYALGQIGDDRIVDKLVFSFKNKDTVNLNNIYQTNILEAIGKTGDINILKSMASVKTYRVTDTMLILGQIKAIYRFALRGIVSEEGTSRAVDLLYMPDVPYKVKLIAAHYLARAKDIDLSLHKIRLGEIFNRTADPYIRMALATALGKSKDPEFISLLKAGLTLEQDYRVKANLIRALSQFGYEDVKDKLLPYLKDKNIHLSVTAADFILKSGVKEDFELWQTFVSDTTPWQVKTILSAAELKHTPLYFTKSKAIITDKIVKSIQVSKNQYEKAAYISALGYDPFNYIILHEVLTKNATEPVSKVAAYESFGSILKDPNFFKAFGYGYPKVKAQILEYLIEGIKTGDPGVIAVVSKIFKTPGMQWREWIRDTEFLKEAARKLKLPKEVETYNELMASISYLEGTEFKKPKLEFNHPIDFALLRSLPDSSIAAIKTSKGLIRVYLYKRRAPGTVANFVSLINEKFYNGKIFHRVVPNFVIQTGCPRGDGYGSLDYSIRSELPQMYFDDEGYIGMASAGNHTEGTQWFITHSPAPHLDGNYTIFGKVVEGMDVVHSIQIGDKITEIILTK
ncbi:MAG: peptidylprolyl isomerase [Saprospiraceae bacterium]|nr:peptidylprolyl isomerase [Saprospiraceae bacterium]